MDQNLRAVIDNLVKIADEARRVLEALDNSSQASDSSGSQEPGESPEGGGAVVRGDGPPPEGLDYDQTSVGSSFIPCTPRQLPRRLVVEAAQRAIGENPANAPHLQGPAGALGAGLELEPLHIALLTSKYWGPAQRQLTVSFMETTAADLRNLILQHMNAWSQRCGVSFVYTQGKGQVRISRASGGYWSYLGTDVLSIPQNRQTMNLEGFTTNTPASEYRRVVRHETGHTLGMPHEHMRAELVARIDPQKAIAWFGQTQGWSPQTVREQVLTPLDERSLMSTPADQTSVMCYQLPGSITKDGRPIAGGPDINETDYAFAAKVYPPAAGAGGDDLDWLV